MNFASGRLQRFQRAHAARSVADSALIHSARVRLTVLYLSVLAGALVVFGLAVYLVVQHQLLAPIDQRLQTASDRIAVAWQRHSQTEPCPPLRNRARFNVTFWACFNAQGKVVYASDPAPLTQNFYDRALVNQAATQGWATAWVDAAWESGAMQLRARQVAALNGGGMLGVVLVGIPVDGPVTSLHVLITWLLGAGALILCCALLGSAFLVNRTLAPVRLAFARQQHFIAQASHELRTPLTLLRADADVLLRSRARFSAEDLELVEDIAAEAAHMSTLSSNLLDLARLDSGKRLVEKEVLDLAALIHSLVQRLGAYAASKGVAVSATCAPSLLVLGDATLLEQGLLALLDNAVKYNEDGGSVVVHAAIRPGRATGRDVLIEVVDTGIGIDAAHLPHLGESFFRVDSSRSRETGGSGLGVAIAQATVHAHGGKITFSSAPGRGTTAVVLLPGALLPERAAHPDASARL